jgi:hypothetical protein
MAIAAIGGGLWRTAWGILLGSTIVVVNNNLFFVAARR